MYPILFQYTFNKQSRKKNFSKREISSIRYKYSPRLYISQFFSKKRSNFFQKRKIRRIRRKYSRQYGVPNERHRRLIKTGCSIPLNVDSEEGEDGEEGCTARLRMATKKSASTVFSLPLRRLITVEAVDGWSGAIFAGSIGRKAGYALKCERRIPPRPAGEEGEDRLSIYLSLPSRQPPLTGSNVDLITGQTSRESRPGRDFISSPWVEDERRWCCDDEQGGRRGRIDPSPAVQNPLPSFDSVVASS